MRIVGGRFRGRPLASPRSNAIRPTTDRTRESLFNILTHRYGDPIAGNRMLDLFAGTGALGLEALSRGARQVLFVEQSAKARGLIRTNIEMLGVQGQAKIFRRDAASLGHVGTIEPFDIVFADPPYGKGLGDRALQAAAEGGWLRPGALCILEETAEAVPDPGAGYALEDERSFSDTVVRFYRYRR